MINKLGMCALPTTRMAACFEEQIKSNESKAKVYILVINHNGSIVAVNLISFLSAFGQAFENWGSSCRL